MSGSDELQHFLNLLSAAQSKSPQFRKSVASHSKFLDFVSAEERAKLEIPQDKNNVASVRQEKKRPSRRTGPWGVVLVRGLAQSALERIEMMPPPPKYAAPPSPDYWTNKKRVSDALVVEEGSKATSPRQAPTPVAPRCPPPTYAAPRSPDDCTNKERAKDASVFEEVPKESVSALAAAAAEDPGPYSCEGGRLSRKEKIVWADCDADDDDVTTTEWREPKEIDYIRMRSKGKGVGDSKNLHGAKNTEKHKCVVV